MKTLSCLFSVLCDSLDGWRPGHSSEGNVHAVQYTVHTVGARIDIYLHKYPVFCVANILSFRELERWCKGV